MMATTGKFAFDWLFIKRFHRLCKLFLFRKDINAVILLSLLLLCFLEQFFVYGVGMLSSKYYQVLSEKDTIGFFRQVLKSVLFVSAISFIMSAKEFVASSLRISWRSIITKHLHDLYFSRECFYDINVMNENEDNTQLDNPDQRMTADVNEFLMNFTKTLPLFLISPFVICYYSYKSYQTIGKDYEYIYKSADYHFCLNRNCWSTWVFYVLSLINNDQQVLNVFHRKPCLSTG